MDAHSFNEMPGGKFLVQNNFGGALGGPLPGKKIFFFANYEALRRIQGRHYGGHCADRTKRQPGDFSQSGVNIFNPFSSHARTRSGGTNSAIPFPATRFRRAC